MRKHPPWRNWLARLTVNQEVRGSSPRGGGVPFFFFGLFLSGDVSRALGWAVTKSVMDVPTVLLMPSFLVASKFSRYTT